MSEQTHTEQTYSRALDAAREARVRWVGMTHDLPDAPREILRLWNMADMAMLAFNRALESLAELEASQEGSSS